MSETVERHEFGAEVGRLLDLVVHALYSDREIFLRELVANAADATDRRRFEALTNEALALPADAKVLIAPDKAARTLTISDAGIGMAKDDLAQNLGTIARSGTRAFSQALGEAKAGEEKATEGEDLRPSLIGQFGVGFYSAFMVADRVTVTSRRAGTEEAWTWASDGKGSYTLEPASREQPAPTSSSISRTTPTSTWRATGSITWSANGPTTSPFRSRSATRRARKRPPIAAPRSGASPNPRSRTSSTRSSTAPSATASTSRGRPCTGGGGRARIHRPPVRAEHEAVHGNGGRPPLQGAAARAAHVHHRRGRAAAELAALRPGRGRYR